MTYRGRHRRRRRGRALRGVLAGTALALTAAATLVSTSQAAGTDNPGPLSPLTSSTGLEKLRLHEHLEDRNALDTLQREMGGSVPVATVLRDADRSLRNASDCDATEKAALPVEPAPTRAYCWDESDAATQQWLPQSVTTSGDAYSDGRWGDDRVILSGWTHNDQNADLPDEDDGLARIAVIDAGDPKNLKYRWVLLVAPRDGGKDFAAVRAGLGGMAWYQDKLIVTARDGATRDNALLVFDMDRILRTDVDSDAVGRVSGGWSAHGYQYVLPSVGSYRAAGGTCDVTTGDEVPCFGSVSLDRTSTPVSLVASESTGSDGERPTRLWRYDYSTASTSTGLLDTDSAGNVDADETLTTETTGLQGVLSHRPDGAARAAWYTGYAPEDGGKRGTLWRQDTGGAKAAKCSADGSRACWGQHTESLSYSPETGELWTLTGRATNQAGRREPEPVPERVLYAVPLATVNDSLE
ncbi:hypothetical protein [Streptomyces cavernae]|uniref:hypothetical protein n=1 Tax=Streptomyces cavernae TaxID=2259034 RepID=UPI000FEB8490|nr:hypothetical protein [Streptomyces cavernae]